MNTSYPESGFYVTLPSNDSSIKAFPENKNNSWTYVLPVPLDMDGEWEMGLTNISLPTESLLSEYLSTLEDNHGLLRTSRCIFNTTGGNVTVVTTVYYRDIKEERMEAVHDLLQALFETERRLLIDSLDSGFQPNPKNYHKQFDVSFNKEQEECLVTATNIGDDSITPKNMIQNVYVMLRDNMCYKFRWVRDVVINNAQALTTGPNLTKQFRHDSKGWIESKTVRSNQNRPHGLKHTTINGFKGIVFYLDSIAWTFTCTVTCTYKRGPSHRALYVYSSLCAPTITGNERTDLLRQVEYRPALKGHSCYEPHSFQYKRLRNNHISFIETAITETDENKLAQFTKGPSILTIHFRRVR